MSKSKIHRNFINFIRRPLDNVNVWYGNRLRLVCIFFWKYCFEDSPVSILCINWQFYNSSGVISYLWGLLNDLSLITIISLINLNIQGLPRSIIKSVMSFAQLDILPSEIILNSLFTFDELNDKPFNPQFAFLGYTSSNGAINMGSAFLYLIFYFFILFPIIILRLLKIFT